ncbi:S-adenosyl-L-methionine-dependent methyltransferase [Trinorchestia longiramus]|nr:S-adenosyl-L-methionine-dependent methyltransferase [Trinorchestia longiramus]
MFDMSVMAWNGGDLEKLEVLQNRVGYLALGTPKWTAVEAIRGDLGWSLFSERMVTAVLNYKESCVRIPPSVPAEHWLAGDEPGHPDTTFHQGKFNLPRIRGHCLCAAAAVYAQTLQLASSFTGTLGFSAALCVFNNKDGNPLSVVCFTQHSSILGIPIDKTWGTRVLDLGCGGGAVGMAALLAGAVSVTFNDVDPVALKAVVVNLKLNFGELNAKSSYQLEGRSLITDVAEKSSTTWDVELVGDLFYDDAFAAQLMTWLVNLHSRGSRIFIGDPGRSSFRKVQALGVQSRSQEVLNSSQSNVTPIQGSLSSSMLSLTRVAKYALLPHTVLENRGFSAAFCWSTR